MTNEQTAGLYRVDPVDGAAMDAGHRQKGAVIPVSTYRMQLNSQLTFAEATAFIPYLRQLGISHCYTSPYLKARPGSSHGYDIVDHNQVNPEIGSHEDFERFLEALRQNGMGLISDIVPNHVGIMGDANGWWLDVLENGQASSFAPFFDIDWHPFKKTLQDKILIPVLGGPYGDILEQRELKLVFNAALGEFSIHYYGHRFPVDPRTYPFILSAHNESLLQTLAPDDPVLLEFQTLDNSFAKLPERTDSIKENIEERRRDKEVFKKHLAMLCQEHLPLLQFIAFRIDEINRTGENNNELHALLERQVYRLAYWRVAGDEINYRRFFDINDLAGLRIEDEKVFDATHRFILSLVEHNKTQGLRIDHADGLYDPQGYYERLNRHIAAVLKLGAGQRIPPIYIVAEKIVANYEYLSSEWPIHGTTGYEFANIVNGLFIDQNAERPLTRCYEQFIRERLDFGELVYRAKKFVIATMMASEFNVLCNQLSKIADASPKTRDYTLNALRDALSEVIACFPVYRTYINSSSISKKDSRYIDWAIEHGRQRSRAVDTTVFDFIQNILQMKKNADVPASELLRFVMRLQQYTAPVMAKGYEDTALYQYNRLVSLNEVGGDPRLFSYTVNAFHHFNQERISKWPHSLLSLSTHDSKLSSDVRARINVLSECPRQWREALMRWRRLNKSPKSKEHRAVISRNDEYRFYQILIGTWPLLAMNEMELGNYRERILNYLIKSAREAKQHTSWINPNEDYEDAVSQFVCRCLDTNTNPLFLNDLAEFERQIRKAGLLNALAQTVLLLTSPGVPDLYQGSELWQFALVDPDNRRPIDFSASRKFLNEMDALLSKPDFDRTLFLSSLLATLEDGRIKLFVVMSALRFRQNHAGLFEKGEYLKIDIKGAGASHLMAFARKDEYFFVIILVPRLMLYILQNEADPSSGDSWSDTCLELPLAAPIEYQELFSDRRIPTQCSEEHRLLFVRDAFKLFPLAILSAPLSQEPPQSKEQASDISKA